MCIKFYDSELKVMEVLWERGDLSAKEIAEILKEKVGWNKNTTYTVIKKCIAKGGIERYGTNFMCKACIDKKKTQIYETEELIGKMFNGSRVQFFNTFLGEGGLSREELERIKKRIEELE